MTRRPFKLSNEIKHPGEMLRKHYLPQLGIEEKQSTVLAKMLQLPRAEVHSMLLGKTPLSGEMADGLGRIFNVDPRFWTHLQETYNISKWEYPK